MPVEVNRAAAAAIKRGHPWVYREAMVKADRGLASGDTADLVDGNGQALGRGLYDASSPLAVRVFDHGKGALTTKVLAGIVLAAFARRDGRFDEATTAYRLCNGEGDRVPGLVADRYGEVVVLRLDTEAWSPHLEGLAAALRAPLADRGVRSIGVRVKAEDTKLKLLEGAPMPERVLIRERGMTMEVDLAHGQKTGAFLDQRENRARVRRLARGAKNVLNLFSYAGGFSIAAALGGAARVTSVDIASAGHASAQRSFRANGLDPEGHAFVTADVFAFFDRARGRGERFDLVISDPPSFAPSERARPRAVAAYRKLHGAAASVLTDEGTLCASSCSSHVGFEEFLGTLDDAAVGRDDLRVKEVHGQPEDHPSLPAWPEGRYLKFVVLG